MAEMMDAEVTAKIGAKHAKIPGRVAKRHASAPASVVLGGQRVKVSRPRARTTDGREISSTATGRSRMPICSRK